MPSISIYLGLLGMTLVVEGVVVARALGRRGLLDGLLLNLFTHPLAVLGAALLFPLGAEGAVSVMERWDSEVLDLLLIALIEPVVILVEALGYRLLTQVSLRRAVITSVVANVASATLPVARDLLRMIL